MDDKITTGALMKRVLGTRHLNAFLKYNEKYMEEVSFTEYLAQLCDEKELIPERVILQAGLDRTYGHQIFNGTRRPSREKVLQLAFGMQLEVESAQKLLWAAGRSQLYPRLKRDAVMLYCLKNKKTVTETQIIMEKYEVTPLGSL
ncbi:MAG: hypothetical protein J6N77_02335 [Lachnospiraceae bacterium]|nr:hypothetical protein [Lachnospiraceae bacterium]